MSLAFSGRRMQLRVRIIRTDRISSFIDTARAPPFLPPDSIVESAALVPSRFAGGGLAPNLLANRVSSERVKEVTLARVRDVRSWHPARKLADPKAVPRRSAVESVEMISQSNCRGILELWGCHLQRMRWNQHHYKTVLLSAHSLQMASP